MKKSLDCIMSSNSWSKPSSGQQRRSLRPIVLGYKDRFNCHKPDRVNDAQEHRHEEKAGELKEPAEDATWLHRNNSKNADKNQTGNPGSAGFG
jgi:hypothetical protein